MQSRSCLIVAISTMMTLQGFSTATAIEKPRGSVQNMRITLSIYSGRENPAWDSTGAQDERFVAYFDALSKVNPRKQLGQGLGYSGFLVKGFRDYDQVVVCNEVVEATRGGKTYRWHDKDRVLERFLLETAKGHIEKKTYESVASQIPSVTAAQKPNASASRTQITPSLYSGLKNPTWTLTEAQDKRFIARFDALITGEPKAKPKPQFGYRGFHVTGFRDYDELTAWNEIVEATRGVKTYRWHDKDRTLERFLLETAKGHLDEDVYKFMTAGLE
jgi:hypothetical protein